MRGCINLEFLAGGGTMGQRIRAYPWAHTPLGEPWCWPQGLRTAVRVLLMTQHPMFIFWGHEHTCLYNDAYSRLLGPDKNPAILGAPGRASWEENWPIIGPQIEQVMRGEGATQAGARMSFWQPSPTSCVIPWRPFEPPRRSSLPRGFPRRSFTGHWA